MESYIKPGRLNINAYKGVVGEHKVREETVKKIFFCSCALFGDFRNISPSDSFFPVDESEDVLQTELSVEVELSTK